MNGWQSLGFKTYKDYLSSDIWKEKRDWIIKNNPQCKRCGSKYLLNVHHLNYSEVGNESRKTVIVLCNSCHKKEHNKEDD